jgi:hypothetical protein
VDAARTLTHSVQLAEPVDGQRHQLGRGVGGKLRPAADASTPSLQTSSQLTMSSAASSSSIARLSALSQAIQDAANVTSNSGSTRRNALTARTSSQAAVGLSAKAATATNNLLSLASGPAQNLVCIGFDSSRHIDAHVHIELNLGVVSVLLDESSTATALGVAEHVAGSASSSRTNLSCTTVLWLSSDGGAALASAVSKLLSSHHSQTRASHVTALAGRSINAGAAAASTSHHHELIRIASASGTLAIAASINCASTTSSAAFSGSHGKGLSQRTSTAARAARVFATVLERSHARAAARTRRHKILLSLTTANRSALLVLASTNGRSFTSAATRSSAASVALASSAGDLGTSSFAARIVLSIASRAHGATSRAQSAARSASNLGAGGTRGHAQNGRTTRTRTSVGGTPRSVGGGRQDERGSNSPRARTAVDSATGGLRRSRIDGSSRFASVSSSSSAASAKDVADDANGVEDGGLGDGAKGAHDGGGRSRRTLMDGSSDVGGRAPDGRRRRRTLIDGRSGRRQHGRQLHRSSRSSVMTTTTTTRISARSKGRNQHQHQKQLHLCQT